MHMKRTSLWIGIAALVVALVAATAAFATTRSGASATRAVTTFAAAATSAPDQTSVHGACGALMNDPAAWKDMQAQRADHFKDMQAWSKQYGSDPNSAAARAALAKLRTEHWNDMRALLQKYGAGSAASDGRTNAAPSCGYGYGAGGMMGCGSYGARAGMMGTY
jgi:hypothetical protein